MIPNSEDGIAQCQTHVLANYGDVRFPGDLNPTKGMWANGKPSVSDKTAKSPEAVSSRFDSDRSHAVLV